MERLIVPEEINGVNLAKPIDVKQWPVVAKAIFGPIGDEGTSKHAKTKLKLPDQSDRELTIGASSTSTTGKLRFGASKDGKRYGVWVPKRGAEPQPFLTQPDAWYEEGYGGILFRTTAGVIRAGAQSTGSLKGRQIEGARASRELTSLIFYSVAGPIYELTEEDQEYALAEELAETLEKTRAVLGDESRFCTNTMNLLPYVAAVRNRLCEVALLNGH